MATRAPEGRLSSRNFNSLASEDEADRSYLCFADDTPEWAFLRVCWNIGLLAELVRRYDARSLAADLLADRGLSRRAILAAGLEPYDLDELLEVAPPATEEDAAVVVPFGRLAP